MILNLPVTVNIVVVKDQKNKASPFSKQEKFWPVLTGKRTMFARW